MLFEIVYTCSDGVNSKATFYVITKHMDAMQGPHVKTMEVQDYLYI